jgi:cytidylate kinase
MSLEPFLHSPQLSDVAEHQLRIWAQQMEAQRRQEEQAAAGPKPSIQPCVTLSRETGVDAAEIARLVAAGGKWKVFDREFLDYMAEHYHWSRIALEYVDERTASWFSEWFGKALDEHLVSQGEFVSRLGKIVLLAAQHETTVFVGRGARLILPRQANLSVRIIAPRKMRIERIMQRRHCGHEAAEKFMDDTDTDRAGFVKRYFHVDVADPKLYDLVINLEFTSREAAVQLILSDFRSRFGPDKTVGTDPSGGWQTGWQTGQKV